MTADGLVAPPIPGPIPRDAEGPEGEPAPPAEDGVPPTSVPGHGQAPPVARPPRRKIALLLLLLGMLIALIGLAIWYLIFRQPILPIPPIPTDAVMPGYSTSIYGVSRPTGVAVSPSGDRIYVTETEGARVARVFDARGAEIGRLEPPTETGADHVPVYVAVDPVTAEVYVSDRPTGSIYVYDRDGRYLREYEPSPEVRGWQPLALAFDRHGNFYVTDLGSAPQRVVVLDRQGGVVRTLGQAEGLSFPNGVTVDEAGNVYVTDSNNGRLIVYAPDGRVAAKVGRGVGAGNLGLPRGAVVDGQGRLYIVDTSGQSVHVYSRLGADEDRLGYLGDFGEGGVRDGAFAYPNGIAADDRGRIYVTDSANHRVQIWGY